MAASGRRCGGLAAAALALLYLGVASTAAARPLTPDDLLQRAAFGSMRIAPGDRWLVVERRGPYREAVRFDHDDFTDILRTTLDVADLQAPGPLRPLFPPEPGAGYQGGPFSPDGRAMALFRLLDGAWELGVVTLATGEVHWLGLAPAMTSTGRAVQWADPATLVVIALAPGQTPLDLRLRRPQLRVAELQAAQAWGGVAATVLTSGQVGGVRAQDPPSDLLRIDVASGVRTPLAQGEFEDLEVSASGRWVAVLQAGEDIALDPTQPVQGERGTELRRGRLRLVRLADGLQRDPCPDWDVLGQLLSWSPDADELLVFGRRRGTAWSDGRLLRVEATGGAVSDPAGGRLRPAVTRRPAVVRAGWLAGAPIVYARPALGAGERADWYRLGGRTLTRLTAALPAPPPSEGVAVDGDRLLASTPSGAWAFDRQGRGRAIAPAGFAPLRPKASGRPPRFGVGVLERHELVGVLQGDGPARLSWADASRRDELALPADAEPVTVPDNHRGAVVRTVTGGGAETLSWVSRDGATQLLATINTHLAAVDPPVVRAVRHRGPAGEPLTSWLLLPADATGRPPPLVVWPYPGSSFPAPPAYVDIRSGGAIAIPALLAGHGYAVLLPSLPTPTVNDGPGVGLAERVLAIVDAAAAQPDLKGAFDPTRLGAWGASFGGYGVLAMLTQTDRFQAAIAQAAPSDLFSMGGDFGLRRLAWPQGGVGVAWSAGWTEDLQGDMRGPPWTAADRYLRNSPALHAERITTPLLIFHGDLDSIPIGQAEQMFSGLFRQAKDAALVIYWGEGHSFTSPGVLADYYQRSFAWLDARLRTADARVTPSPGPGPGPASNAPTTPPSPPASGSRLPSAR